MFKHVFAITPIAVLTFFSFALSSWAYELEWDQTKVEIELKPGETEAKAEFVVTNKGEKKLSIDRVKTSCGCTGSILDKKEIKPGESTTIIGTFKKGNRQGSNHNRLQVFLKGKAEPVETLHMIVQVPRLIHLNPFILYWNKSSAQPGRQVPIKLDTRYLTEISDIEYDPELLVINETDDPSGNFDRILTISPKSFDKQLRHSVLIKATGKDDLTAEMKLQVFVQP